MAKEISLKGYLYIFGLSTFLISFLNLILVNLYQIFNLSNLLVIALNLNILFYAIMTVCVVKCVINLVNYRTINNLIDRRIKEVLKENGKK